MGLFGSSKEIYVASNAASLMEPNEHALSDAVLYAILSRTSVTYGVLNVALTGMGIKSDQIRRWAKDNYTLGLSQGGLSTSVVMLDDQDVADVIAIDLNLPDGVLVNVNVYAPLVFMAIAQMFLINHRGIDLNTDIISIYPDDLDLPATYDTRPLTYTVAVQDISLNQSDYSEGIITYVISSWYTTITRDNDRDSNNGEPVVEVHTRPTFTHEDPFEIPAEIYSNKPYLVASYYELDGVGTPSTIEKFWYYDMESNKYPDLTPDADLDEDNNTMPTIPIRYNNSWVTGDIRETGTQLLRRLSMSWEDLVDKLSENPDIADIDHAYIMFGVNLQDPGNIGCQYLTEFFDYLSDLSQYTAFDNTAINLAQNPTRTNVFSFQGRDDYEAGIPVTTSYPAEKATVVNAGTAYSLIEHGLKMSVYFSQITSCIQTGSIGVIGTATMETEKTDDSEVPLNRTFSIFVHDSTIVTFRHQITDNAYKEVKVYGLYHRNSIYDGHDVVTTIGDVVNDSKENNFVIPIHFNVSKKIKTMDRNLLYEASFHLILNSYEIVKVEWYESGFFKAIIMIVTLVLAVWSGQAWMVSFAAAIGAGIGAVMQFVLMNVLMAMAISEGFKMVAEMIGPELMAVFGIVLAIASVYFSPGSSFKMFGKTLATSDTLLSLSSAAFKSSQAEITNLMEDIGAQYEEFLLSSAADTKKLEDAQALLKPTNLLVYDLLAAQNTAYAVHPMSSEPTKFYNSTVHAGNIGTMVLDVIPNYVDISVKLPKPDIYAFGNSPSIV